MQKESSVSFIHSCPKCNGFLYFDYRYDWNCWRCLSCSASILDGAILVEDAQGIRRVIVPAPATLKGGANLFNKRKRKYRIKE